jgi:hypothetical protein
MFCRLYLRLSGYALEQLAWEFAPFDLLNGLADRTVDHGKVADYLRSEIMSTD